MILNEKTQNNEVPVCEIQNCHKEIVISVKERMPEENCLFDLAELFKVFGDSTRVRILSALSKTELCVCDIAELLNMTISSISHQLRILKQASLVKYRKEGKMVIYSLADQHVITILNQGLEHVKE